MGQARLLVRGTPGQLVGVIEWTDFVKYLDEPRGARRKNLVHNHPFGPP
jgi:hypothetical protein